MNPHHSKPTNITCDEYGYQQYEERGTRSVARVHDDDDDDIRPEYFHSFLYIVVLSINSDCAQQLFNCGLIFKVNRKSKSLTDCLLTATNKF